MSHSAFLSKTHKYNYFMTTQYFQFNTLTRLSKRLLIPFRHRGSMIYAFPEGVNIKKVLRDSEENVIP